MAKETASLAILFADIAKSTQIYETLGNEAAKKLIDRCISVMVDITGKHNGTVIKTIGDEIMCTFPSADNAVDAAMEMHQELEQTTVKDRPDFVPPNIYAGIQYGPVILDSGDVFGDAVNVAARMVAFAKQRQIITTEETVNQLSENLQNAAHWIDKTNIKGKSGEIKIYEIIWEEQELTVMFDASTTSFNALATDSSMELSLGNSTINVNQEKPAATLGRQVHNDIVVNDGPVSRSHARIEYRRGKFVLIDQSSNGTFVVIQGKKEVDLLRDETTLLGEGIIGLGRRVEPDSPVAIHYKIKI